MGRGYWSLETALDVAEEIQVWLARVCTRVCVVGAARRERPQVRHLDLLVFPKDASDLDQVLITLGFNELVHARAGDWTNNYRRVVHCQTGMPINIYLCDDIKSWATRLVLLTGSKEFIKSLEAAARAKTYNLTLDGVQIATGKLRQPRTELGLFRMLGVQFCAPEFRQ